MNDERIARVRTAIRSVPNFPVEGILFKDITPVLGTPGLLSLIIDCFVHDLDTLGGRPEAIVAPEARGFIFGAMLAERQRIGFVPVRKAGKLPGATRRVAYALEYGNCILEMHADALQPGQRVLLVDDLIATGGTIAACAQLCKAAGAEVQGALFLIELTGLKARENIDPIQAHALMAFSA